MKNHVLLCLILVSFIFTSCQEKLTRKTVAFGSVEIEWAYYRNWRDYSPDYIFYHDNNRTDTILEAIDAITDVRFVKDTLVIDLYKPERAIVNWELAKHSIDGISIKYYEHQDYNDYLNVPVGK